MGNVPRKAEGRRVFDTEFKQTTIQRILTGEKTIAELSRELERAQMLRSVSDERRAPLPGG